MQMNLVLLLVLAIVLLLFFPVVGLIGEAVSKNHVAHKHVNIGALALVLGGLMVAFVMRSGIISAYGTAFNGIHVTSSVSSAAGANDGIGRLVERTSGLAHHKKRGKPAPKSESQDEGNHSGWREE